MESEARVAAQLEMAKEGDRETRARAMDRRLNRLELQYAEKIWSETDPGDRPPFAAVLKHLTPFDIYVHKDLTGPEISSARKDVLKRIQELHDAGGEWQEAALDAAVTEDRAYERSGGAVPSETVGLFSVNQQRVGHLEDYGIAPTDDLLEVHIEEAFVRDDIELTGETLKKSLTDLAVALADRHRSAKAVYGRSWLMSHPLAKRIGFTPVPEVAMPQNKKDTWMQFLDSNGNIDEKRAATLLATGKPPYPSVSGFIPLEDFLQRYLPAERRGTITRDELTPESIAAEINFVSESEALRRNWDALTPEGVEQALQGLPEVLAALDASGVRDAFTELLRQAKRDGLDWTSMQRLAASQQMGQAIRGAHRRRVQSLRSSRTITIE